MRTNRKLKNNEQTHEGAPAAVMNAEQALRRSVMSCFLFEDEFYENGDEIGKRIAMLARQVRPEVLSKIAIEARNTAKLRHMPLLLAAILCETGSGSKLPVSVADTISQVIHRADEMAEFIALYAKLNGVGPDKVKKKLSSQAKKGLAKAFAKFDQYQFGKYNRDSAVKLRDVMFMVHPKPMGEERTALYKSIADNTLVSPDTWEVALSGGADKKETFERLLKEGKLGYLALLRNLRNMAQSGVDESLVLAALKARKGADRVLPFRYVSAARAVPKWEPTIDEALLESVNQSTPLPGKTIVLVDVSGSMDEKLSGKSDLKRIDAAAALASVINGQLQVYSFSVDIVEVPPRRGMSGIDAVIGSQEHLGTDLAKALDKLKSTGVTADRIIVITDEQVSGAINLPTQFEHRYMINVASNKNGIGYGGWVHIDGFSENTIRFIHEYENSK